MKDWKILFGIIIVFYPNSINKSPGTLAAEDEDWGKSKLNFYGFNFFCRLCYTQNIFIEYLIIKSKFNWFDMSFWISISTSESSQKILNLNIVKIKIYPKCTY